MENILERMRCYGVKVILSNFINFSIGEQYKFNAILTTQLLNHKYIHSIDLDFALINLEREN
ncbi:hypothetical protein BLOT_002349 [Blomia tropicalis]|nr:hypothetical protein BLOT_002349 [Blomia tropicalis]